MFAKQEKDVVFFETVVGLARQRRHCLVECIPVPRDIAKQAPLYFKKVSSSHIDNLLCDIPFYQMCIRDFRNLGIGLPFKLIIFYVIELMSSFA